MSGKRAYNPPLNQVTSVLCTVSVVGILTCGVMLIYFGVEILAPFLEATAWKRDFKGEVIHAELTDQWYECDCTATGIHSGRDHVIIEGGGSRFYRSTTLFVFDKI